MLRHTALFLLALGLATAAQPAAAQLMRASGPAGPSDSAASRAVEDEADTPEEIERAAYDVEAAPVFYVSDREAKLRGRIGGGRGVSLPFRDEIRVLADYDDAFYVEHDGRRGWLDQDEVSNLWIRIDKSDRTVYVYRGAELWQAIPTDVSLNPEDDKTRRSALGEHEHYRIPEGTFFVTRKNPRSQYYRAFVINYPNEEDAERGLREGLITDDEYRAIVKADLFFEEPPMNTKLGGLIELHGNGSGERRAWTRGCLALRNPHMDLLWDEVAVGTPVIIEP
jgi:hypothetical protein